MTLTGAAPGIVHRIVQAEWTGHEKRRGADAATVLMVFIILLVAVPSELVVKQLGGNATPAMLLGLLLLLWWTGARMLPRSGIDHAIQPVRIAIGLVAVSTVAAYASGILNHIQGIQQRGADRGILYFGGLAGVALLAMDGIDSRKRLDFVLKALVVAAAFSAFFAMMTFFFGVYWLNSVHIPGLSASGDITFIGVRSGLRRVSGTSRHPLEFGMLMALVLPIALHYAFWTPKPRNRRWWLCTAMIAFALPMSVSRAAIVGLIISGIFLFVTWPRRRQRLALLLTPFYLGATHVLAPHLLSTLSALFQTGTADKSITHRTSNYARVGSLMRHHWLFGTGGFGSYSPIRVDYVLDNAYLGHLFETGLVGLSCLFLLLVVGLLTARGARRRSSRPSDRDLAQSLAASMAVVIPALFTFDAFSFPGAIGAVYLIIGCCGALWRLARTEQASPQSVTLTPIPRLQPADAPPATRERYRTHLDDSPRVIGRNELPERKVGWNPDPTGRYLMRWFDGDGWGSQTSDGHHVYIDRELLSAGLANPSVGSLLLCVVPVLCLAIMIALAIKGT